MVQQHRPLHHYRRWTELRLRTGSRQLAQLAVHLRLRRVPHISLRYLLFLHPQLSCRGMVPHCGGKTDRRRKAAAQPNRYPLHEIQAISAARSIDRRQNMAHCSHDGFCIYHEWGGQWFWSFDRIDIRLEATPGNPVSVSTGSHMLHHHTSHWLASLQVLQHQTHHVDWYMLASHRWLCSHLEVFVVTPRRCSSCRLLDYRLFRWHG